MCWALSWQQSPLWPPWEFDVFKVLVEVKLRVTPGYQEADTNPHPDSNSKSRLQTLRPHRPGRGDLSGGGQNLESIACQASVSPPHSRTSASIQGWLQHHRVPSGSWMFSGLTSDSTGWQIAESPACWMFLHLAPREVPGQRCPSQTTQAVCKACLLSLLPAAASPPLVTRASQLGSGGECVVWGGTQYPRDTSAPRDRPVAWEG